MLKEEFKINVGEMNIIDKKAKANPDKGEIRFYLNEGLLFFEWKNLTKNITKEPLVITPGDWIWKKIGTSKGRVYMLQNTLYPEEEKFLFYMQFPISLDEKNSNIINNILKTGTLIFDNKEISNENKEQNKNNNNQNLNNNLSNNNTTLQNNISNQNTNQQNNQNNINSNLDFIKNFTEAFRQAQKKYPKLGKILTRENIINLLSKLNENEKNELIKKLPEKQQSIQGFHDNISSPQFQQGLDALSSALNSENLQAVIQSFGLDLNEAQKYGNGVEAFIKCIIKKFSKEDEKKNENNEEKKDN
jgi:hypothetical protein